MATTSGVDSRQSDSFRRHFTIAHGKVKNALNSAVQRTRNILKLDEVSVQRKPTSDTDVEKDSTTSTTIEDAMTFCAADEAACSTYGNNGNLTASEYHKMLSKKLGASLSTDGQVAGTIVIRSTRQQVNARS
jgi:hypothetical protein